MKRDCQEIEARYRATAGAISALTGIKVSPADAAHIVTISNIAEAQHARGEQKIEAFCRAANTAEDAAYLAEQEREQTTLRFPSRHITNVNEDAS